MNIMISTNREYIGYACIMLMSLKRHHKNIMLSVYILHNELTEEDFTEGAIDMIAVLCKAGLVQSRSEGRRAIEQGGVTLENEKVTDIRASFDKDVFMGEGVIVKRGKKNFRRVIFK